MEIFKGIRSPYRIMEIAGAVLAICTGCLLLYQILEELNHPTSTPLVPSYLLIFFLVAGAVLFIFAYFKERQEIPFHRKKHKKETEEERQQKKIVKPVAENEVASWKVDGMRQYYEQAKYELNVYIRDLEQQLKDLTQQKRELYIIHDLITRLVNELICDEIRLSCVEIYLIFAKLELYHVHHEKRLYESYKVNLTPAQQYHMDMILDPRTREIIRFRLRERYAFLPDQLESHLFEAVRSMELAADAGNVYAQFDLANVYLSSEFYGGMEAAVFYLHRADNAQHSGASQLLHQLQTS